MVFGIMAPPVSDIGSISDISHATISMRNRFRRSIGYFLIGATITFVGYSAVIYCLARTGRDPLRAYVASKASHPTENPSHLLVVDPLLVNLEDEKGSAYLRLSLVMQVANAQANNALSRDNEKSSDAIMASIRDTALTVLGKETVSSLLAPDGKESLKSKLKVAFTERNPMVVVKNVYFTEFLVQK